MKIIQGQGKVREFLKMSGKFFDIVKVSEKSGNLLVKSNALGTKCNQKQKEVENEEKNININMKKAKANANMDCFSSIKASENCFKVSEKSENF